MIVSTSTVGTFLIFNCLFAQLTLRIEIRIGLDFFVGTDFSQVYSNTIERAVNPVGIQNCATLQFTLFQGFSRAYSGNYFSGDFNGCSTLTLSIPVEEVRQTLFVTDIVMFCAWLLMAMIAATIQARCTASHVFDVTNTLIVMRPSLKMFHPLAPLLGFEMSLACFVYMVFQKKRSFY